MATQKILASKVLKDSILLHALIYELRDPKTDRKTFRNRLEKVGACLASEILDGMSQHQVTVTTQTGAATQHKLAKEEPVLVTVLRAGLPLLQGLQKIFQSSEVGFLAMSRNEETLAASTDYIALPELKGRTVILADTMLATGGSCVDAIQILEKRSPREIVVAAAFAAEKGIARVRAFRPQIKIFAAVVDPELNPQGFIVPGLGDAGDRSYGPKAAGHGLSK